LPSTTKHSKTKIGKLEIKSKTFQTRTPPPKQDKAEIGEIFKLGHSMLACM